MENRNQIADRFKQQINFLIEVDKIKNIFRRTRNYDHSRYENDAEHCWHMSVMVLILAEYANDPQLNINKVIKMALIHDIVEIDAGDTFLYDTNKEIKQQSEKAAASRIFGLLPVDQRDEFIALWEEFEEQVTAEAKFAGAIDRLGPVMQSCYDNGHAWKKHGIDSEKVLAINNRIENGSIEIWNFAKSLIEDLVEQGNFK